MRVLTTVASLVMAASVTTPAQAAASIRVPEARVAGGDVVELTYPSVVNTRIKRADRALDRATRQLENGAAAKGAKSLKVVRRQLAAAWRGARYVIRTTPPPPAEEARA